MFWCRSGASVSAASVLELVASRLPHKTAKQLRALDAWCLESRLQAAKQHALEADWKRQSTQLEAECLAALGQDHAATFDAAERAAEVGAALLFGRMPMLWPANKLELVTLDSTYRVSQVAHGTCQRFHDEDLSQA